MESLLQVNEDGLRELQSHHLIEAVQGQELGGDERDGGVEAREGGDRRDGAEKQLIVPASEAQMEQFTQLYDKKQEIEREIREHQRVMAHPKLILP
jgi:hypothetical protein